MSRFLGKRDKTPEVDERERFKKNVKDARRLLDFAVSEGAEVDDDIIKEINRAAEFLYADNHPDLNHRIAFEKAYRDLAQAIHPVTIESWRTSTFLPRRLNIFSLFFIIFLILVAISITGIGWEVIKNLRYIGLFFFVSFLLTGFLWFLDLFTGVISKARFIEIVIMCYAFTIFALSSSVAMFAVLGWHGPTKSGESEPRNQATLLQIMTKSPIGIVKGCVPEVPAPAKDAKKEDEDAKNENKSNWNWAATEVKCNYNRDKGLAQWVINLGGTTEPLPTSGQMQNVSNPAETDLSWPSVKIYGGVVVPLYVVILSLMGGAISMTRRVPEYQRRVYLEKKDKEHLTREHARQFLVFQIMQFFTAPLIAITAYYLLKPDTRTMSVVLGFASGFASEIVLGAIGAFAEKLVGPAKTQA